MDEGLEKAHGGAGGETAEEDADLGLPGPRRPAAIWKLAAANLALALMAGLGIFFLWGAEGYLLEESYEFGRDLEAARTGISILRVACWALVAGFLLSAAGVLSVSPLGWRFQALWALLLCFTLAGLAYGVPVLRALRRPELRERFFPSMPSLR